ncbi:hypothetical protein L1D33_12785 [Vibrio chagasii]|uniref:hypothetical protein n=1 Tax=Vibrio chagasii TaxID=170679 RepID=UPI001EFE8299|nr:hypothetical protein [Vibrio chagasii]MCG9674435.1 hypothetical protein [Vibrio chagasii]
MKKIPPLFISVILPLLALIIPVCIAYFQTSSHELTVEWVSTDNLVSSTEQATGLKVLFEEKEVVAPKLIRFRMKNTGNEPIHKSDFDTPLMLQFNSGVTLVKANVPSTEPASIPVELNVAKDSLELKPLLLNADDTIHISVIVSGEVESIEAIGRIAKISNLELVKTTNGKGSTSGLTFKLISGFLLCFTYMYFLCLAIYGPIIKLPRIVKGLCGLAALVGSVVLWESSFILLSANTDYETYCYIFSIAVCAVITVYLACKNDEYS